MRIVLFCHSLRSDWNHGNAHFLRGVLSSLQVLGHDVAVYEPVDSWSRANLEADHGPDASLRYREAYPGLSSVTYDPASFDYAGAIRDADVVVVHEWNAPQAVAALGRAHATTPAPGRVMLFHDTHHRCITASDQMRDYDLRGYDGVLAFGQVIQRWYAQHHRLPAWTWHEAADHRLFKPLPAVTKEADLVWVGNWGDEERTAELHAFLIEPVRRLKLRATVYGVRYPQEALEALRDAGIRYGGYLPNHEVPRVFAQHRVTVHVPRGPYVRSLPGIPTIRPFEALACGIPLVSAPWCDDEHLFRVGEDFLMVDDGAAMTQTLRRVLGDTGLRQSLADHGRETILSRHTCDHRAQELLHIVEGLRRQPSPPTPPASRKATTHA